MGLNIGNGDRCFVSCDDPHARNCVARTELTYGQSLTASYARQHGWYKNGTTGKWACPPCVTGKDHDVRLDYVGVNPLPRFICYTPVCHGAILVAQPHMTSEVWKQKRAEFLSTHPAQKIKNEE